MAEFYEKGIDFQKLLREYNKMYGDEAFISFARESGAGEFGTPLQRHEMSDVWDSYNEVELDRIRHYYGQKLAAESEGALLGSLYMLAHEIGEAPRWLSEGWGGETQGVKGTLYDLYINALALEDYLADTGLPGEGLYYRMKSGDMPKEEFEQYGSEALKRAGYGKR